MKSIPKINMTWWQKCKLPSQNTFDFLTSLHTHSGNLCQMRMGLKNIVVVNHPEYAQHVLQTNVENYPKDHFYKLVDKVIGKNILTTNDMDFWSKHRKMMAGSFQQRGIEEMGNAIIEEVGSFMSTIDYKQAVCINHLTTKLTLHIITRLLFSSAITNEKVNKLADLTHFFAKLLIKKQRPFALPLIPLLSPGFRKSQNEFKELIKTIIASGHNTQHENLLTRLKAYRCPTTNTQLTDEQIFSESALMIFAGHETTANAVTWLLIALSKYPGIRQQIQVEIQSVIGEKTLTVKDLDNMPYLRAVCLEVLRLFPSFPGVARNCAAEDEIDGYRIPAGSMIVVNIAMIHRHPEFWTNPEGFMPERFLNSKLEHKYAFLPFINGPRVCIGRNLALIELQIVTAMLLQKFTIDLLPGADIRSNFILSLRTKNDVYGQFNERHS